MTAKRFLAQGWRIDRRIDRKIEEAARMRAKLTKATQALTGMPRGGSGADWTDADVAVMELEAQIRDEIKELCRVKRLIREAIDQVDDKRLREVLDLRYVSMMTFEQIAVELHYSWRHVLRLHDQALRAVRVPDEDGIECHS